MHPVSCTNPHHDVTDLVNHGIDKNTKTWISLEQKITFLLNKKILNLCLRWHIFRSYCFVAEVTFKNMQDKKSSSLVDINNFSKSKGLSRNQALKIQATAKNTSIVASRVSPPPLPPLEGKKSFPPPNFSHPWVPRILIPPPPKWNFSSVATLKT